jgi:hypothetical protein
LIGSVNRDFAGFAREFFTDTGVYALRMDSAGIGSEVSPTGSSTPTGMTLDQRAVMLATAVSVDFDYFSRHSGAGGFGFMPLWIPGMGGEAAGGAAAGEAAGAVGGAAAGGAAAGEAGAIGEVAAGTLGRAGAAGGMADGMAAGVTGAGAMAGYEAMQRGFSGDQSSQSVPPAEAASQQSADQPDFYHDYSPPGEQKEDVWGQEEDPWSDGDDGGSGGDDFDWF